MVRFFILLALSIATLCTNGQKMPENYYRAQAALQHKNYILAQQQIDSAIIASKRNPYILVKKGEILFTQNDFKQALYSFEEANKIRSNIASLWEAKAYAMLNNTVAAIEALERHLSSAPRVSEAKIILDTAFLQLANTPQWKTFWLNEWYNSNELLEAEVEYHFSQNEWELALDLLNQKMDGKKSRHQFYALRGKAYSAVGSYKAAEADFAHALKRSKRNDEYMANYGRALDRVGKHKKAIKLFNDAILRSGGNPDYFMHRAKAYLNQHDFENAFTDINHYLSYYPSSIDALSLKANIATQMGRNIDALFCLRKLIELEPSSWKHYAARAELYLSSKNWEVAKIDLNRAIELNLNDQKLYLLRGKCRNNLGERSQACTDWKKAVKLGSFEAQELIYKNCR
ncbi:MAG TPA: tetratricopeptide repeat protein [Perlabentimonas sp.]|nr:tetratricopeptide repeat protein [Bacteroidales bacterium]MDD4671862.1 tetratricopeptide repeat protein [Bacteroidales bacterium]HZJ74125.1 tetratricopeptide repeat protein [Perlabentimonas sp.]